MYKVFFNEHQLVLVSEIKNSSKYNMDQAVEIENVNDLLTLLLKLEGIEYVVKLLIICKSGLDPLNLLYRELMQIPAAGGVVLNKQQHILFIKRLGHWDLPKGKIEDGESPEQAAVREVEEECGISGLAVCRALPHTFHMYRSPYVERENNWVLKETFWFEMNYSGIELPVPQSEEQIEAVRWFSRDELPEVCENTFGSLKEMIGSYLF